MPYSGPLLYSRAAIYGAVFLGINLVASSVLLVFDANSYEAVQHEDGLIENGTAFLFVLTASLLVASAAKGGGGPGRWLYILAALAFVFAAGEEIDWGQRIFGFETPGRLRDMNVNDAFNLHNIEGVWTKIHRVYRVGIMLLCVLTGAAYFLRRPSVLGVPFPSFLVMYCFLVGYVYRYRDLERLFPLGFDYKQHLVLLLFIACACFQRNKGLLVLSVLFLFVIVLEQFILHVFSGNATNAEVIQEWCEYLVSIACAIYAGELFASTVARVRPSR